MPKTVYFCTRDFSHSGVDITWTKTANRLNIGGWYDGCVGIQDEAVTLREFFDRLGITEKDTQRAWKQANNL